MTNRRVCMALSAAAFIAAASSVRAVVLDNILPAALDQPQINATITLTGNTTPQTAVTETFNWETLEFENTTIFNIQAYFDTGASGILISTPTATLFNLPTTSVIYSDVGVGGTDDFQVSGTFQMQLAHYYQRTDLDQFADVNQTVPITSMYVPVSQSVDLRAQVGPYNPTAENPLIDDLSEFLAEYSALDVIGMPAMKGKVIVIDPRPVNNFPLLLDGGLDLENVPDVFMRTFVYSPGTPFHPGTQDTDPGIPATSHHVKLTYASFDRFTQLNPVNSPAGPTLAHNPFIGKDPVAIMDGQSGGDTPGIKITRVTSPTTSLSSEGNWLLDTGAAASMISQAQALALGVKYVDGTYKTDTPALEALDGGQLETFTLTISGIGEQFTAAGFFLDSLLVRTMEGNKLNDNDPNHIKFNHVGVLVADIRVKDPITSQELTLDGIFGMNMLTASVNLAAGDFLPEITDLTTGYFNWITFDEPGGILGLDVIGMVPGDANGDGLVDGADFDTWFTHLGVSTDLRSEGDFNGDGHVDGGDFDLWFTHLQQSAGVGALASVPEPASLGVLAIGMTGLLLRRRRVR